jgi:hypothetical protein
VTERKVDPKEQLIEQLAQRIHHWRMAQPALFVLEVTKPLSFLASQGLLLCEPVLGLFFGEPRVSQYASFLEDRTGVESLIARLEQDAPVLSNTGEESD